MTSLSRIAIISLICGIIGAILIFIPIAIATGILCILLAIIFGIRALMDIKKDPKLTGKGMAIAGIILGIITILAIIISFTELRMYKEVWPACIASEGFECGGHIIIDNESLSIILINRIGTTAHFDKETIDIKIFPLNKYPTRYPKIFFCNIESTSCDNSTFNLNDGEMMKIKIVCPIKTNPIKMSLTANYIDTKTGQSQNMTVSATDYIK